MTKSPSTPTTQTQSTEHVIAEQSKMSQYVQESIQPNKSLSLHDNSFYTVSIDIEYSQTHQLPHLCTKLLWIHKTKENIWKENEQIDQESFVSAQHAASHSEITKHTILHKRSNEQPQCNKNQTQQTMQVFDNQICLPVRKKPKPFFVFPKPREKKHLCLPNIVQGNHQPSFFRTQRWTQPTKDWQRKFVETFAIVVRCMNTSCTGDRVSEHREVFLVSRDERISVSFGVLLEERLCPTIVQEDTGFDLRRLIRCHFYVGCIVASDEVCGLLRVIFESELEMDDGWQTFPASTADCSKRVG